MKIFVSYRRVGDDAIVGRIVDRLRAAYGVENVWQDLGIVAGGDWWEDVYEAIRDADAVLVCIGPDWLRGLQEDPEDFVRKEVETAIWAAKRLVPVILPGGMQPEISQLPHSMEDLVYRQSSEIYEGRAFDASVTRLIDDLYVDRPEPRTVLSQRFDVALVLLIAITLIVTLLLGLTTIDGDLRPEVPGRQHINGANVEEQIFSD